MALKLCFDSSSGCRRAWPVHICVPLPQSGLWVAGGERQNVSVRLFSSCLAFVLFGRRLRVRSGISRPCERNTLPGVASLSLSLSFHTCSVTFFTWNQSVYSPGVSSYVLLWIRIFFATTTTTTTTLFDVRITKRPCGMSSLTEAQQHCMLITFGVCYTFWPNKPTKTSKCCTKCSTVQCWINTDSVSVCVCQCKVMCLFNLWNSTANGGGQSPKNNSPRWSAQPLYSIGSFFFHFSYRQWPKWWPPGCRISIGIPPIQCKCKFLHSFTQTVRDSNFVWCYRY